MRTIQVDEHPAVTISAVTANFLVSQLQVGAEQERSNWEHERDDLERLEFAREMDALAEVLQ